jgi:hypothetical protein
MSSKQVTIALIAALAAVSHAQFAIPAFPNIPIGNINGHIPKPFLNLNPTPAGPVSGHSAGVNLTGAGSLSSIGVSGNYGYTTPSGNQFGAGINVSPGGALSGSINYIGKFEEEEWEVNAGISGSGGKPTWNVGVSHSWEDEQELQSFKTDVLKIAQTIVEADKMGIFEEGAQVQQGLKKIVKKAVKAAVVLNQSGLLEEIMQDEPQSLKSTLKKVVKVAVAVDQAGVLEEGWEVSAGVSGSGGSPTWNVGIKGSWEEEEEEEEGQQLDEQKFKLKKTLNKIGKAAGKISNAYDKAQQIGVLEEEGWEVNAGISGSGGKPTWNVGVSHSWEEDQPIAKKPYSFQGFCAQNPTKCAPVRRTPHHTPFEEDELEVNAGISGGQGKPTWTVGVSHKWEEDQVGATGNTQNRNRVLNKFKKPIPK